MMHIYPRSGGTWRDSVAGIRKRIEMFNGRRVFGVVHGSGLESPDGVIREIADISTDCVILANDPSLREVMTWPNMLERLRGESGNVFYCHSKGATHGHDSICQEWREVMFEACLDVPQLISAALQKYPICGAFRRTTGLGVPFHFSGSFYWFRLDDLWGKDWGAIDQIWHGVESWPSKHFGFDEAFCLFLDYCGDLYDSAYWERTVRPSLARWRQRVSQCTA